MLIRETDDNTKSAAEREEIDPIFKDVLMFFFGRFNILPQTQVEVSRLPRTMDALVIIEQSDYLSKLRLETPFGYFRVYNQIEFKGKNDRLTIHSYHLILGRAHLYLGEKEISVKNVYVDSIQKTSCTASIQKHRKNSNNCLKMRKKRIKGRFLEMSGKELYIHWKKLKRWLKNQRWLFYSNGTSIYRVH